VRFQICQVLRQFGGERMLKFARFARCRHDAVVFRDDKLQHPVDEIAKRIGEIVVHAGSKPLEGKRRIATLGCVRRQPPAPVVRRQQIERLVEKHASVLAVENF